MWPRREAATMQLRWRWLAAMCVVLCWTATTGLCDALKFKVVAGSVEAGVVVAADSGPEAIREAVGAAARVDLSRGLTLKDAAMREAALEVGQLQEGAVYTVHTPPAPPRPAVDLSGLVKRGVVPRVMMLLLATGRYRTLGMDAVFTARRLFGGDCETDYYFLTDDVEGLDADLHPRLVPHHDWPMSALQKYGMMLGVVEADMPGYDYVYVMDADVEFQERVTLADVSGDLVAVPHPDYPRFSKGFCDIPKDKDKLCSLPFERNSESAAYVPKEFDRLPTNKAYATWFYLQSSFWGGKAKFVLPAMRAIAGAIQQDLDKGLRSTTTQDERYFNWYFWSVRNDPNIMMRVLSHSFAYPLDLKYYGKWITAEARPILRHHYNKGPEHLPVEEAEMFSVGIPWNCMDAFPRDGPYIGIAGCHHLGKTQMILWSEAKPYIYSPPKKGCLDAAGLKDGDTLVLKPCTKALSQQFDFERNSAQFVSRSTGLCVDAKMEGNPRPKYLGLHTCSASEFQQWDVKVRRATWK